MITVTFADQSTLTLTPESTLTFWMHSHFKLAFERGMEQSLAKIASVRLAELDQQTLLALFAQSACFTVANNDTEYFFTQAIVKVQY